MKKYLAYNFGAASTLAVFTTFTSLAAAQEPGTNVATPPPTQTPPALTGQDASVGSASTLESAPTGAAVSTSAEPVIDAATTRKTLPNRPLLITGLVLLGASYGASAIVAATSDREADEKLYYPVVGPWLDLNRRGCDVDPCSNNTRDRVLLAGDGVIQGIGALSILLSLMVPEKTTRSWYLIGNNEVVVAPQLAGSMLGLGAVGRF